MVISNSLYSRYNAWLFQKVSIAPLIVFRIVFGLLLFYSIFRTYQQGWIEQLYIYPSYHFSFISWVKPISGEGMYVIFGLLAFSALGIACGLMYRLSTIMHFLLFSYIELLDKTYYLNHYYLVTLLVFWMIWVPAHHWYSIDVKLFPKLKSTTCSNWHILIFKLQLSLVYFFAGLAKVNSDWLLRAQPMATWLPGKYQLPLLGSLMKYKEVAFVFSWVGCFYDLTIWVFLWLKKTRAWAYVAVIIFHVLTGVLFPRIGMFPYIMITSTIIFFSSSFHERLLSMIGGRLADQQQTPRVACKRQTIVSRLILAYLIVQLFLPLRHVWYEGNLFWHEQGYRFSWRVMLIEKNGYTSFIVRDPKTEVQREIDPSLYLTDFQRQQLRSQPDMIIQFARHLGDEFVATKGYDPEVYVKSRISLNAWRSQRFTDETYNLYGKGDPMQDGWIIPFEEK